jgi:hypothetical protein
MPRPKRDEIFTVHRGRLVRQVERSDGRGYMQHCSLDALKEVAWLVEERGETGVTTNELWEGLPDLPCTQISIALAFMKERGCVQTEGRRSYAASKALFEDVMIEFHALAHAGGEAPRDG